MRHRRLRKTLVTLALVAVVLLVGAFATGRLSFVTTRGISMLPNFHTGDLVVLRASGSYHVGEVVAYRSPLLHTTVLHRIIAEHGGLFTFKGDNNDFVDPLKLPATYINGTMLLHIPKVGAYVSWLQQPLHGVPVALGIVLVAGFVEGDRRRRRKGRSLPSATPQIAMVNPGTLLSSGAVLLVASVALLAFGSSMSPTRPTSKAMSYTETVDFSYSATTTPSATYPTGLVATGDPVFLKLVHSLVVSADYHLRGPGGSVEHGTIALVASLSESDGWSHSFEVGPPTAITGTNGTAQLTLPLGGINKLVSSTEQETGLSMGDESINVAANVVAAGTVAGQAFSSSLSPSIQFVTNPLELSLLSASSTSADFPQLHVVHNSSVELVTTTTNEIGLFGHHLKVSAARSIGLLGSIVGAAVALAGLVIWRNSRRLPEEERTRRRLGHELIEIENDPTSSARGVVDVASLGALVNLAEHYDAALLDYEEGSEHVYFAVVNDIIYRHRKHGDWVPDGKVVLLNLFRSEGEAAPAEPVSATVANVAAASEREGPVAAGNEALIAEAVQPVRDEPPWALPSDEVIDLADEEAPCAQTYPYLQAGASGWG